MEVNVTDTTSADATESESAVQLDCEPSAESTNLQNHLDEFIQTPKPTEDANKNSLAYMLSKEHSDAIKRHWTAVGSPEEKIFGEIQNETTINVDAVKYTFGVQAVKGSDTVEIPNPFGRNKSSHAIKVDENNEMLFESDLSNFSIEATTSAVSDATLMENNQKHDFVRDSQNRSVADKASGTFLEKSSEISNEMNHKYGQLTNVEMDASDTTQMRCCKFEKCASHMSEEDKNKADQPCRRKRNFLFRFFGNLCGKGED